MYESKNVLVLLSYDFLNLLLYFCVVKMVQRFRSDEEENNSIN